MIKAGIIGAAGYTAGELIRILLNHPEVAIAYAQSTSQAGQAISGTHHDLAGDTDLRFQAEPSHNADVVFICAGHGKSRSVLTQWPWLAESRIIDLGSDFRLKKEAAYQKGAFVYGLTEANRAKIAESRYLANPGCFATAIQLALLPLASAQLLKSEVHVHGITGSTGAGQQPSETTHFSWRDNNVSVYKAFSHQHLAEISETLQGVLTSNLPAIHFLPLRGNFTRGIFCTAYTEISENLPVISDLYRQYYAPSAFVHLSETEIHLKQVTGTNKAFLHLENHGNKLLITSILDNLLKGASGQAVQNMNLMFGLPEHTGLQLKAIAF